MPKDIIYPKYIGRFKGWYIYSAYSIRDVPFKATKKGRRTIFAESIKDLKDDIARIER